MITNNTDYVIEIEKIEKATRKYVIEFNGKTYETDCEKNIIYVMDNQYIDSNDDYTEILKRINLARELMIYSIIEGMNIEIWNGNERIEQNYILEKDDINNEDVDIIINVEDEISMFSGINEIGYAKIYIKNESDTYFLF